jgi:alkylmercury lyase
MTKTQLDEMIKTWDLENNGIPPGESTLAARLEILMYRALAEGYPVSAACLAALASVPIELAEGLFEQGKALGGEWDEEGRLVGNVLTLLPTQHRFRVNGRQLYTWCSLDAIHLPGLLGRPAEVDSVDPVSGQAIHLDIPPDGEPTFTPAETVLTIVLSAGDRSGPQSPLCRQMHFFASRENAAIWVRDHPNATVMSVEEVYQLVREHVHIPLERALQQLTHSGLQDPVQGTGQSEIGLEVRRTLASGEIIR